MSDVRALLVSGEYPPRQGGVGDYTALLTVYLRRVGVHADVLTGDGQPRKPDDATPRPVAFTAGWGWRCWSDIVRAARSSGYQVLHVQYQAAAYGLHPAIAFVPLRLRLLGPPLPVVTTLHDLRVPYLFPKAGPLRQLVVRLLATTSAATVCTDPADLAVVRRWGAKAFWIPIGSNILEEPPAGFSAAAWRERLGVAPSDLLVVFFGFRNASKGLDVLLDAVALLRQEGHPVRLLLLGGETGDSDATNREETRRIERRIHELGLAPLVLQSGFLTGCEIAASLRAADVCALPYADGASLRRGTLMAALVQGAPVVTTRGDDPPPTPPSALLPPFTPDACRLRDGENLVLVPRGDAEALARALLHVARTPDLRRRLIVGGQQLARHVSWWNIASATRTLYERLLT
jgi:glycosyltransferase involved in cell wall biosynthesis